MLNPTQSKRLGEAAKAQSLLNSITGDAELASAVRVVANTVASLIDRLHEAQGKTSPVAPVNMRQMAWGILLVDGEPDAVRIDWADPMSFAKTSSSGSFDFPLAILTDAAAFEAFVTAYEANIRNAQDAAYEAHAQRMIAQVRQNAQRPQRAPKASSGESAAGD